MRLACTACAASAAPGSLGRSRCCGAVLQPHYTAAARAGLAGIAPGPGIDRYRALLPVAGPLVSLGEGDTPLLRSRRLGPALGLPRLFFKLEARNPTGAFKDRAAAVAVTRALEAGASGVLTASSGNAAAAIASYSAAAGLRCLILLEPGNPGAKLRAALAAGAELVPVAGLFARGPEALSALLVEVAQRSRPALPFVWAPVNPFLLEGLKTIAYEIAGQLPGVPDLVVCPVGGGDLVAAQWRGWQELREAGVVGGAPRLVGVQSKRAAPLLRAWESGSATVPTLERADSQLSGINVAFSGEHALAAVRASHGAVCGVDDEAAIEAGRRLAREEGLWVEPAAAATLAALPALLSSGILAARHSVVCLLSSAGHKSPAAAEERLAGEAPVAFEAAAIAARAAAPRGSSPG